MNEEKGSSIIFNLPVGITAPYVDIINVQDFDNTFARCIDDG